MAQIIPLIRAAAIAPLLRWMMENARPWANHLEAADLPSTVFDEPLRPVPLVAVARFVGSVGASEGPDIGCRVVSDTSVADLAMLGRVALGSRTPREAFERIALVMPHHSSHEMFTVSRTPEGIVVRDTFAITLDDHTVHLGQQYVAALIHAVTAGTGISGLRFSQVELTPHPTVGLAHLYPWLGPSIRPAPSRTLAVSLPGSVLDRPYLRPARDRTPISFSDWPVIRGDGTLSASVRAVLPGIVETGQPTIARLAALAETSPRTFQRRLASEGTSLAELLQAFRREQSLARLAGDDRPVREIAAELGYAGQSSLTRAMRRWYDTTPMQYRRG